MIRSMQLPVRPALILACFTLQSYSSYRHVMCDILYVCGEMQPLIAIVTSWHALLLHDFSCCCLESFWFVVKPYNASDWNSVTI